MSYLPCGSYFDSYRDEQKWWRTPFIKFKMILMVVLLACFPLMVRMEWVSGEWLSIAYTINYYILAALGVQLLIGYCGQITLGHAAFVAVGAYASSMMVLFIPWPQVIVDAGLAYPISMICAGILAGLWSVLFGLPSARVKGFYLIMTTMAAQWITVPLVITQYVSQIGGRGHYFSLPPGTIKLGPWVIDSDEKIYYLSVVLVALCLLAMGNIARSKLGRAWVAIRDNDIAAETMGVNIVWYKLLAFFVAGFFAGIAGSFYISALSFVSPEHYEWFYSLLWVGIILIGGVGSIQGVVFGSAFVVLVFKVLEVSVLFVQGAVEAYPSLAVMTTKIHFFKESAFGLAIIFFLIYEPNGLAYRYWQLKNYFNLWPFSYTGKGS
ncbi:MAG: branched-chain amino acid ABC transporter permease [Thermodesulfobacteriota bacterium]